jgi:hypothetical protein
MSSAYLGNPQLKKSNVKLNFTQEQIEEYMRCSEDPEYFVTNYCYIQTLDHGLIKFDLYECQKKKIKVIHENRKVIVMEGRQQGKCVLGKTLINIKNKKTNQVYTLSIGDFHEWQRFRQWVKEQGL